jgi:hypothetical protein
MMESVVRADAALASEARVGRDFGWGRRGPLPMTQACGLPSSLLFSGPTQDRTHIGLQLTNSQASHVNSSHCCLSSTPQGTMPPRRTHDSDPQSLKEKLHANARDRRTGKAAATNGSSLKEVDNVSTHSGQHSGETNASNVSSQLQRALGHTFRGRVADVGLA